jgi:diguanylate cyclase (GGDEF)-like protein
MKLAERLRENVSRENFKVDSKELYVSLSLGVSTLRPTDVTFDTPLRRADQALYEAKQQGRNRTIIKS